MGNIKTGSRNVSAKRNKRRKRRKTNVKIKLQGTGEDERRHRRGNSRWAALARERKEKRKRSDTDGDEQASRHKEPAKRRNVKSERSKTASLRQQPTTGTAASVKGGTGEKNVKKKRKRLKRKTLLLNFPVNGRYHCSATAVWGMVRGLASTRPKGLFLEKNSRDGTTVDCTSVRGNA